MASVCRRVSPIPLRRALKCRPLLIRFVARGSTHPKMARGGAFRLCRWLCRVNSGAKSAATRQLFAINRAPVACVMALCRSTRRKSPARVISPIRGREILAIRWQRWAMRPQSLSPQKCPQPNARRRRTCLPRSRSSTRLPFQFMETIMPMPRKPTPIKFCENCGSLLERKRIPSGALESLLHFGRRKFCDQKCMGQAFDARETTGTSWATTHYHARKMVPHGPCSRCGKLQAMDVHHEDGNHQNNSRENLSRICRSCHTKVHRPRSSCSVCGDPAKGFGFCEMHYQRFKKHGDPMIVKINQHG